MFIYGVVMVGFFVVIVIFENKDGWKLEYDGYIDGFKDQVLIRIIIVCKRDIDVVGFQCFCCQCGVDGQGRGFFNDSVCFQYFF